MKGSVSSGCRDHLFRAPAKSVATIFAIKFFGACPRLAVASLFPQLMIALAVGPSAAGTLMMGNSLSAIAVNLIYNKLTARLGTRILLLFGGMFCAFGLISLVFSPTLFIAFLGFGLIGGIGWGLFGLRAPQELVNSLSGEAWATHTRASLSAPLAAAVIIPTFVLFGLTYIGWQHIISILVGLIILVTAFAAYTYRTQSDHRVGGSCQTLGVRTPAKAQVVVSTCVSGYITGTLNTHIIIIASIHEGRATSQIVAWSIGFALISILSVNLWPSIRFRRASIIGAGLFASFLTFFAIAAPSSNLALMSLLVWVAFSSGHYIDALKNITLFPKSTITHWNGRVLVLHMTTGGGGALCSGYLAERMGSYSPVFATLVILFLISLVFTSLSSLGAAFGRQAHDVRR